MTMMVHRLIAFKTKTIWSLRVAAHTPTEFNDIKADLRALPIMAETIGRVHKGFKKEVDELWPMMLEGIQSQR